MTRLRHLASLAILALVLPCLAGQPLASSATQTALEESLRTQKPLLICFFAVWCPACNLYKERVLPTPQFQALSKQFVVLVTDVDDPESYALKSHFHITGYPTLLVAQPSSNDVEGLKELGRVVGYRDLLPLLGFLERAGGLSDKLEMAKAQVQQCLDSGDASCAQVRASLFATLYPNEPYFSVIKAKTESEIDPALLHKFYPQLSELLSHPEQQSSATLKELQSLLLSHATLFSQPTLYRLKGVFDVLQSREDPASHAIAGIDMADADLDWARIDWAKALKDPTLQKQVLSQGLLRSRQLLAQPGQKDSKALNLEYADMLGDNGDFAAARAIYRRMIALHPKDFTFYFAAAKNELKAQDGAAAKTFNDQALKLAYGDNLIRVAERQVRILTSMKQLNEAIAYGQQFLLDHPKDQAEVRRNRYLDNVATAIAAAVALKNSGQRR